MKNKSVIFALKATEQNKLYKYDIYLLCDANIHIFTHFLGKCLPKK